MLSSERSETLTWKEDYVASVGSGLVSYNVPGMWVYRIMRVDSIADKSLMDMIERASARAGMGLLDYIVFASVAITEAEESLFLDMGWRWVFVGTATSIDAAQSVVEHEEPRKPLEWEGLGVAYL